MQLKSCREFIEEELRPQSQYQIQAAKKQLVKRIKDTHSEVKVSELQPAQETNTTFTADKNTLSACGHLGDISSRQSFSFPGLFSIDHPSYIMLNAKVEVLLTAPISFSASRLCCQLTPAQSRDARPVVCPVTAGEGQFRVMIQPSTTGLHQLRVLVDGVDIYGSPFNIFNCVLREDNLVTFAKGFTSPCGIAVTDDGQRVIVTDSSAHCVTVLSNAGEVVSRFGRWGCEPGKFEHPNNVAISADKRIFVVDGLLGTRVQKFTFSSSHDAVYDATNVYGVAIHPASGKVLCTNYTKRNVTVLNADLTFSHLFGDRKFSDPYGIAMDTKGMVYVTDAVRGVVLKFTPDGKHLATIGNKGDQPYQFAKPTFICIDSNDTMYVTDCSKHQVMMFTTEGKFLGSFVRKLGGHLLDPVGLAADKSGNTCV